MSRALTRTSCPVALNNGLFTTWQSPRPAKSPSHRSHWPPGPHSAITVGVAEGASSILRAQGPCNTPTCKSRAVARHPRGFHLMPRFRRLLRWGLLALAGVCVLGLLALGTLYFLIS